MIIQCTECQARFRLADEKIKTTGTKVRCSKCKHVFTVFPAESQPGAETHPPEAEAESGQSGRQESPDVSTSAGPDSESDPESFTVDQDSSWESEFSEESAEKTDFTEAEDRPQPFGQDEAGGPMEFDFPDQEDAPPPAGLPISDTEEQPGYGEFDFGETDQEPGAFDFDTSPESSTEHTGTDDVSFDKEDQPSGFEIEAATTGEPPLGLNGQDSPAEFSFDDNSDFASETGTSDWGETSDDNAPSFDFDEPSFDTEIPGTPPPQSEQSGFGEIDFDDDTGSSPPSLSIDADPPPPASRPVEPRAVSRPEPRSESGTAAGKSTSAKPGRKAARKSSSRPLLLLLLLLLLALGGAAGTLYMQEGTINLGVIAKRFPALQPYLGQPADIQQAPQIGINILATSYVTNREAGQLLVVQGEAINNYPNPRSSITIKGILVDSNGKKLMQQTVFCGNNLSEKDLRSMPFTKIEEAMNNQFGDSLSNMNVAARGKIPFTVVFRNLPEGIANINIEVVDSKPGSS